MPSLLTAQHCASHIHLILGTNALASTRATQSISAGAVPIIIPPPPTDPLASATSTSPSSCVSSSPGSTINPSLQRRLDHNEFTISSSPYADTVLFTLGREQVGNIVDAVFITDVSAFDVRGISDLCTRCRIPINVSNHPKLCTFSLLSIHTDGPLQIGVTTSGNGCKLASRIRREIASSLPTGLGGACERLGKLRRRIQHEDQRNGPRRKECDHSGGGEWDDGKAKKRGNDDAVDTVAAVAAVAAQEGGDVDDDDDSLDQDACLNKLVVSPSSSPKHTQHQDDETLRSRQARWLAQVCEYYPLKRLTSITDPELEALFSTYPPPSPPSPSPSTTAGPPPNPIGTLTLAGTGPGHPGLVTLATLHALQTSTLILADKLIPSAILELIPKTQASTLHIARKFPGNADNAQNELLDMAHAGILAGERVLRLKQGDPFLYGRGGEEILYFAERGLGDRVSVIPGLTSALTGPAVAGIPVTQRNVAEGVVVCTGVGTGGKKGNVPSYEEGKTAVFLMALNRVSGLVDELTKGSAQSVSSDSSASASASKEQRKGAADVGRDKGGDATGVSKRAWPAGTPCAVVERASCPDQRVIRTTLGHVIEAVETEGSRPPGLLVVGMACEILHTRKEGKAWTVEEGFNGFDMEGWATMPAL